MPLLVLDSTKKVVLANDAMSRLLAVDPLPSPQNPQIDTDASASNGAFLGRTLPEIGIDIVEKDVPIWVNWGVFLDNIGQTKTTTWSDDEDTQQGERTPTGPHQSSPGADLTSATEQSFVHDVALQVAVSRRRCSFLPKTSNSSIHPIMATMIITVWIDDDTKYFTLTFTSTAKSTESITEGHRQVKSLNSTSSSSSSGLSSPSVWSPSFPPEGPPSVTNIATASSAFQKLNRLKTAVVDVSPLPTYAIWHDGSVGVANKALMRLCHDTGGVDNAADQQNFLTRFACYTDDFSRPLEIDEYPVVKLLQTKTRVTGERVGIKDPKGTPFVFAINGELILHEETGEFLGGLVILHDVTQLVNAIEAQKKMVRVPLYVRKYAYS